MPLYTNTQPSKSLADRLYSAEFDDAVVEQHFWKNPRYDGCKISSKEMILDHPKLYKLNILLIRQP